MTWQNKERGFTLVELLVALFVFGLISVAGVTLLRSSSDGQWALKERLNDHSALMRTANLLEADLAQAMARPVRDQAGTMVPAFTTNDAISGQQGELLFAMTRGGLSGDSDSMTPDIGRVLYHFTNGALTRTALAMPDGTAPPQPAKMLTGLQSASVRFRSENGQWLDKWTNVDQNSMPRTVEMVIKPANRPELRFVMMVGSQVRPQKILNEAQDSG